MDRITVFDKEYFLHIPVISTFEGNICPYSIADGIFTKLVTAYHSIQSDLLETQAMITYLQTNPSIPAVVKTAMFKAFIIQYGKCFSQAWGRNVTMKADDVYKAQMELLSIHNEVMQMRNNYIAHAGNGKYEYGAMVIYLNPDSRNPSIERIIYTDLKFMDHSLKLPGYAKICKHALEYVNLMIEQLQYSYNNEVDTMELKYLYKISKMPDHKDWQLRHDLDMLVARDPRKRRVSGRSVGLEKLMIVD